MQNNWSIDNLQEAWNLASRLHKGQAYAGPQKGEYFEYINHIGSVSFEILQAIFKDTIDQPDLAIHCALLHDILEDTPLTEEALKLEFGPAVTQGVLALTKNEQLPDKETKMRDSLRRIKAQPKAVWAVKLADRIVNMGPPPFHWPTEKRLAYQKEARLILAELGRANEWLAQRLNDKIEAYTQYIDQD
ncbi:MAG TPA: HD domain-containing protein [Saprospiraceae bacterium]|nr:HD domain-containing protein [Saprospiraceae bacterium]